MRLSERRRTFVVLGSTAIVLTTAAARLEPAVEPGTVARMGRALFRRGGAR